MTTREEIIKMAREAGFNFTGTRDIWCDSTTVIERFFHMVCASEREACAKLCDDQGQGRFALEHYAALTYAGATHDCAAAIRRRSEIDSIVHFERSARGQA